MGRPLALSDGEVDLGAHSFFPTPHPQKVTVTYVSFTRYSSGKKHVEGFPEQFLNYLRRYVGKLKIELGGKMVFTFPFLYGTLFAGRGKKFSHNKVQRMCFKTILVLASNFMYQWAFLGVEVSEN